MGKKLHFIRATEILLDNPYGSESITIKNKRHRDPIKFGTKVEFQKQTDHIVINLGKFAINLSDDGEILQISKNGNTLFTIQE